MEEMHEASFGGGGALVMFVVAFFVWLWHGLGRGRRGALGVALCFAWLGGWCVCRGRVQGFFFVVRGRGGDGVIFRIILAHHTHTLSSQTNKNTHTRTTHQRRADVLDGVQRLELAGHDLFVD